MKQLKKLVFLLFLMSLICSLLIGCTPKPAVSSQAGAAEQSSDGPANQQTDQLSEDPIEEMDEDDMEIIEEYTFEVGDNFGVGGN